MSQDLTPEDIKAIRSHYGLSQKSFAKLLGLGEASIARYEKGQEPSKANANLIRAAKLPRFMLDCLHRDGESLQEKERNQVEKIVYAEVYFGEGEEMDINEMYELTLQQEVLTEKAWGELADISRAISEAKANNDDISVQIFEEIKVQVVRLAGEITTPQFNSKAGISELKSRLDGLTRLIDFGKK